MALSTSVACGLLAGCAVSPVALTDVELAELADQKLADVTADQDPITGAVDLQEAIARALKYNLDHQVGLAEQAVRERELRLAHFNLLPGVVASSGYAARDSFNASNSVNVLTGNQSLATSTSQEKKLRTSDIAFSWNILDFGLSYVRARQAADKVLVQSELRRKVAVRIVENVRATFWRAVSAQRLLGQVQRVEAEARDVEREARQLSADGQTSRMTALTYEREIVELQRTIGELTRELNTALAELGALMNVQPGTRIRVAASAPVLPSLPSGRMADLIHVAMVNRPELREVQYQKRINEHEAHAALLEMLPGLSLVAGGNYDSNDFLLNNNWVNWGAKAGWNLLKVFSYPARRDVIEEQDTMFETRSLAVTMAIMTQVYVSRVRYAHAAKEYRTARRYRDVQRELRNQIRTEAAAGRVSRQTKVREELNTLVAEAKLDLAYAAVQSAFANVETSLGRDPFGGAIAPDASVAEIAHALRIYRPAASWSMRIVNAD
ncbi:MAG: TolC family protein [Hyphomicrobiaceae bacterium]|nr:TolC family protein [Hyphomicrobiaceae bacterium]